MTERASAEQFAADLLARKGESVSRVIILQANYDFPQLKQWRDDLRPLLFKQDGVFSLDIDEIVNKLRIGVVDAVTLENVQREVIALGVPSNALLVEVQPMVEPLTSLRDRERSVKSGFQIEAAQDTFCTLGVNALWKNFLGERVLVTASHCSLHRDSLDYGRMSQNKELSGNWIGTELYDREPYYCSEEQPTLLCRAADATLYEYDDTVDVEFGYITRTQSYGVGQAGSLIVHSTKPRFEITDESDPDEPVCGNWVNKVGRTTGWTRGMVSATCVDSYAGRDFGWYICQDVAGVYADTGDSGSPVFVAGGTNAQFQESSYAELSGILWARIPGTGCTVYSHIYNVEHDLGKLVTSDFPH
jgi:hypothetical protein